MNIFYILDSVTIAIAVPTMILWGLLVVAAREKCCYPWPAQPAIPAICVDQSQPRIEHADAVSVRNMTTLQSVRSEILTYLLCTASGSGIFIWCNSHLFWQVRMPLNDLHIMIPAFTNMCISVSLALPVLWCRQLRLFCHGRQDDAKSIICSSQFILSISTLFFAILLTLPIIQLLGIGLGLSSESVRAMRDVLRLFVAFSTIPTSIAGVAIAMSGDMVRRRKIKTALDFLRSHDVTALDAKTVDELHYLIEVALKDKKIDSADRISMHLLRRVENSLEI
ncbi:MAG: hypothetical protein P4L53_21190 [Candidatus Obscuribacterales bacterium]|nr:hypothetical protein [Candidatus Obscuribacterales bacterium]